MADQVWLLVNAGCQLDVSACLSVGDRKLVIRQVVKMHKAAKGVTEITADDLAGAGVHGVAEVG